MRGISSIDYVIIAAYFVLSLVIGVIMTRRASSSIDEYYLAGRRMPWWLLGIAGMTAWFDMTGTMIITAFLFMLGPRGIFIEFRGGAVLVLAFMLCYTGKWHRRSGCMTLAEWMTFRFGKGPSAEAVRLLQAITMIIFMIGLLAYLVRGCSLFMGMFFPYSSFTLTLGVILVSTIYTILSGFYGVVLTDLIQGVIIMFACVAVAYLGWSKVPDVESLAATAQAITNNVQWISSTPHFKTSMPPGYEAYGALFMFAAFYLLRNVLAGLGSGAEPRYFGARSDRDCGLQSLLQGLTVSLRWPMMMAFAVMGIYLVREMYPDLGSIARATAIIKEFYPDIAQNYWHDLTNDILHNPAAQPAALIEGLRAALGSGWEDKLQLVGFHGTVNPERILPAVMMRELPSGLKGFILVAMFAALMSTFTSTTNIAASFFVRDIYQNFLRPRAKNRELIIASYLGSIVIVAFSFQMGISALSINDIWGWIIMGIGAGNLVPLLLRLYWWRMNAWGMFGGILLGGAGAIIQRLTYPELDERLQFMLVTGLSIIGTIGMALLTPPTPRHILINFYRITRPFGAWGPVLAEFPPEERREMTKEHRADILAVPFALVWQVTLFMIPMQLVIRNYASFWRTLPLFLIGVVGMYWFWWRNLPRDTPGEHILEREQAQKLAAPV